MTYVRTIKYPWRFDCFADKAEKEPVNVVGGNTFITYEDLWRPRRITATMWPYYLNLYKYTLYCLQVYLARKTTHVRFRLFIQRITCGPYMATLYDWIPIFEWYERRLAVKNGNQETRLEWLPCSKNVNYVGGWLGSTMNTSREGLCGHVKRKRIFTLTSYFASQLHSQNLTWWWQLSWSAVVSGMRSFSSRWSNGQKCMCSQKRPQ